MGRATHDRAVDRVAGSIRAEILSGGLGAGSPVRETAAAERYGVSRHTVRAALQQLAAERLVVIEPYRGARVARFGPDEIRALQELRAAVEVEAVRLAHERAGADWPADAVRRAEGALARLDELAVDEAAGREVDWLEVERVHLEFHRALVSASGSPRIIETHDALGGEMLLFLLRVRPHYTPAALAAEHRALLDDARARGGDAVRAHLEHSMSLLA